MFWLISLCFFIGNTRNEHRTLTNFFELRRHRFNFHDRLSMARVHTNKRLYSLGLIIDNTVMLQEGQKVLNQVI